MRHRFLYTMERSALGQDALFRWSGRAHVHGSRRGDRSHDEKSRREWRDETHPARSGVRAMPPSINDHRVRRTFRRFSMFPFRTVADYCSSLAGRQSRTFEMVIIFPQVHLRKPCYDFYFLLMIKFGHLPDNIGNATTHCRAPVRRTHQIIQSVVETGGVYKGQGCNQREFMTRAYWNSSWRTIASSNP